MSQEITKERWVELSQLLPRVENAFLELEEKAHRLAKTGSDSRSSIPDDFSFVPISFRSVIKEDLALLGHRVAIAEKLPLPMVLQRPLGSPTSLMTGLVDCYSDNPLRLFSNVVNALRWLEECRDEEPAELGNEVKWLVPQFTFFSIEDGPHTISGGPDGTTTGITRIWLANTLASRCQEGRAIAHEWAEKAEAEVAKQERNDAQQACAKAEKERDSWKVKADLNIREQLTELGQQVNQQVRATGEQVIAEVEKGTAAVQEVAKDTKETRKLIQRLWEPAVAIFKKDMKGILKWWRHHNRRVKYTDEMKREVMQEVRRKKEAYMPPNVPRICEKVLEKYGLLTADMPAEERERSIRNFQRACEKYAQTRKNKSTII